MFELVSRLVAFAILIADIWAVSNVLQSGASKGAKIFWGLLIFVLPILGLAIWFVAGPRSARRSAT